MSKFFYKSHWEVSDYIKENTSTYQNTKSKEAYIIVIKCKKKNHLKMQKVNKSVQTMAEMATLIAAVQKK